MNKVCKGSQTSLWTKCKRDVAFVTLFLGNFDIKCFPMIQTSQRFEVGI
jgi:hypothetical protein